MKEENDYKYALKILVEAIENFTNQLNVYPMTEKSYEELKSADNKLVSALSLARELLI